MCGLAGLVSSQHGSIDTEAVLSRIAHRGPDAQGSQRVRCGGADIWLGHTRLSILDLSEAGAQPMASRDGRWLLSFNGEVYNHQSVRSGLSGPFRGPPAISQHGPILNLRYLRPTSKLAISQRVVAQLTGL